MEEILDYKYKERSPLETVQIIKDFFKKRNYEIQLYENQSEANTYSCHLSLMWNKKIVAYSNGKGVTKELALASGYAELYERFCSKIYYLLNNTLCERVTQASLKKNGYYFAPGEKQISYEEILSSKNIFDFYKKLVGNDKDRIHTLLWETVCGNHGIGIPFHNLFDDTLKYFDPRVLIRLTGSSGFSAGNTFYEAFVQGFSECIERFTAPLAIYEEKEKFYEINLDNIQNSKIKDIINKIQESKHEIHIYDLSYTYGTPVAMVIMVGKETYSTRINFGCFPVFDIAVERAITEMYQNVTSFQIANRNDLFQIPHKEMSPEKILSYAYYGFMDTAYVPLNIQNNTIKVEDFNREGYLDNAENITNIELYEYYKDFIQENDLKVYYYDNSLMEDIKAIYIYIDNLVYYTPPKWKPEDYGGEAGAKNMQKIIQGYVDLDYYFKNANYFDYNQIRNILTSIQDGSKNLPIIHGVLGGDWLYPYYEFSSWNLAQLMHDICDLQDYEYLFKTYKDFYFYPNIKKYITIQRYQRAGYEGEELKTVLKYLCIDATDNDLEQSNNLDYLLINIVLKPLFDTFKSKSYNNFVQTLIK